MKVQIKHGAKIHHRFRIYEWPMVPVPDGQSEVNAETVFETLGKTETGLQHLTGPGFEIGSACLFAREQDLIEYEP